MSASGLIEALRPFLWLALAAFITGFLSYVALRGAPTAAQPQLVAAPASGNWNLPKQI